MFDRERPDDLYRVSARARRHRHACAPARGGARCPRLDRHGRDAPGLRLARGGAPLQRGAGIPGCPPAPGFRSGSGSGLPGIRSGAVDSPEPAGRSPGLRRQCGHPDRRTLGGQDDPLARHRARLGIRRPWRLAEPSDALGLSRGDGRGLRQRVHARPDALGRNPSENRMRDSERRRPRPVRRPLGRFRGPAASARAACRPSARDRRQRDGAKGQDVVVRALPQSSSGSGTSSTPSSVCRPGERSCGTSRPGSASRIASTFSGGSTGRPSSTCSTTRTSS